jgi:hypothetical protein
MSRDDYHVVVYKILAYLYECLKADVVPKLEKVAELVSIEPGYLNNIYAMMLESDYLTGIHLSEYKSRKQSEQVWIGAVRITEKGIEYLMTNSLMAKAKDFLGDTFLAVIQTAIAATQLL